MLFVVALLAATGLQGCGGGSSGKTTTTAGPAHTSTKTTTTLVHHPTTTETKTTTLLRRPPMSVAEAVKYYNKLYFAYAFNSTTNSTPKNDTSPLGITISFAATRDSFSENLYCSMQMGTGCFKGQADCRMSAAIFNWKMISQDYKWASTMGRDTGYIFNETMVENLYGKCFWVYDGATGNNYNGGCGRGADGGIDCNNSHSAYHNICKSTGKTCTAKDEEVKIAGCKPWGEAERPVHGNANPPADKPCFFPGPALNYPVMDQPNMLREMVNYRVQMELKTNDWVDWNEVVIDERILVPEIWKDPASAIPAFVMTKQGGGISLDAAKKMQKEFSTYFKYPYDIPIIGINNVDPFCDAKHGDYMCKHPTGPFYDPDNVTEDEWASDEMLV